MLGGQLAFDHLPAVYMQCQWAGIAFVDKADVESRIAAGMSDLVQDVGQRVLRLLQRHVLRHSHEDGSFLVHTLLPSIDLRQATEPSISQKPRLDSIAPVLDFVKKDMNVMINSFQWK